MSNDAPVPEPRGSAEDRPQPLPLTPSEAEALRAAVERIIRPEVLPVDCTLPAKKSTDS